MSVEIENRPIALITGACGGIGRSCARRLGASYRLALTDVNASTLEAFRQELNSEGFDVAVAMAGDLLDDAFVAKLVAATRLVATSSILVHSAGLSPSQASWQKIISVNTLATHFLLDAFAEGLGEGDCAILVASIAGHFPTSTSTIDALIDKADSACIIDELATQLEGMGVEDEYERSGLAYSWSKRGVIRLVESRSVGWAEKGARIVSVSPGMIYTPMGRLEHAKAPHLIEMIGSTPIARWGSPNDIALATEFLVSQRAAYITGTDLRIDGGVSIRMNGGNLF